MRLHLAALPHVKLGSPTTHLCAYSGKIERFVRMMRDRYEIIVYTVEGSVVPGAECVDCLSERGRINYFGPDEANRLPAWPTDEQSVAFNMIAAIEIKKRADPHDLVLLSGGYTHAPIRDTLPNMMFLEPFVGYEGVFGGNVHAAYESYFHMAEIAWRMNFKDIRWYDRVIYPYFDPDEFPHLNDGKGDYLLFIGRLITRKGPHIAWEIAKRSGLPLVVAGAGGRVEGSVLYGQDVRLEDVDYRGPVGIEERAKLMAGARAVIVPTTYAEPGGNVAIEAMACGTPVIAPDWGVFAETVEHGRTGFHFRTLRQAIDAVNDTGTLNCTHIQYRARERFSLKSTADKFSQWFSDIETLWGEGWYAGT